MSKWYVSVGMSLSIDYDGIIAETKEEAIEIAKSKALEDIDYNNCDLDTGNPKVYCCFEEDDYRRGEVDGEINRGGLW